jgi:glycine cleavage system H lipoate-binding protein
MAFMLAFVTFAVCIAVEYYRRHNGALATVPAGEPTAWPDGRVGALSLKAVPVSAGIDADLLTRVPRGVFLAPGHTWLQLERSGGVRLGGDRFPLTALGGVDRLDVVPEGTRVRQGDVLARLKLGQRGLRLLSPVEGTVTAVNRSLLAKPDRLHSDPYEGGWFCSIRPERLAASLKRMVIAEETEEWMRSELGRLRDILSSREGELTALADGGSPVQGLACCLGQEEWEAFVERFFEAPARPGSAS